MLLDFPVWGCPQANEKSSLLSLPLCQGLSGTRLWAFGTNETEKCKVFKSWSFWTKYFMYRTKTYSSLTDCVGTVGVSLRQEFMEAADIGTSQTSSDSILIGRIFFFFLSSFIFFLGRARSKTATGQNRHRFSPAAIHASYIEENKLSLLFSLVTDPFLPMLTRDMISPRLRSDIIRSGWS